VPAPTPGVPAISGQVEAEATGAYADRACDRHHLPSAHFRSSAVGPRLSSLGLGTYIGAPDAATDAAVEEAVVLCLASGRINVIDTAINYRYQRAERSVGRALARLVASGRVRRSEVFVATKQGYLAPDAESEVPVEEWVQRELLKKGVLARRDIVDDSHAMSVGFLADQFERSRSNLGLATIDLLYLHNAPDAQLPAVGRTEFLNRLVDAFRLYERLRAQGALRWYGLATWESLRVPRSDTAYLSLEEAVATAREAGGDDHGLRFVQFPFNRAMPEAAQLRNQPVQGERRTLFDAARRLGLGCFTSVPLGQGQFARVGPAVDGLTSAQTAAQFARSAPGTLTALLGQKRPEHLSENLRLAERAPWSEAEFQRLLP
jgi:aryl-alcohol dehydrogenase-like predicted oxidoreductase